MWQRLVRANPDTHLRQFAEIGTKLTACGITTAYRRLSVFHVSAMPRAYLEFFVQLGGIMDVQMYLFNPSREFWIDDPTVKQHLRELAKNGEALAWLEPPHPLLSGFGRGTQAFLASVVDATEGDVNSETWGDDQSDSLLHMLQADLRGKGAQPAAKWDLTDGSLQFHACHGPLREVEVVQDLILRWLAEHPGAQPREIQVLVPDMESYAPFIESVFRVSEPNAALPCSISKRPAVSAGAVAAAFVRLMKFHESRMTAPETLELLELDPVRERYGLAPEDPARLRGLVNRAGIRWGRDAEHLQQVVAGAQIPDTVTWRRGLDRLLAGFALGRCAGGEEMIQAGALGALRVCDEVEADAANLLGTLCTFLDDLGETATGIRQRSRRKVSEWAEFHTRTLERFFRGTESSFRELTEIRRGIKNLCGAAKLAGDPEVGAEVVATAIEAQLGGMAPAGSSEQNAVLFTPLRSMQVTPRRLIILLGVNEGVFPRADMRPAFDLLARQPRYGDRSLRHEDRLAFLEAILSARDRLILTYTGRNITNNKELPPSPAVTELRQYLASRRQDVAGEPDRPAKPQPVATVEHLLHGFNPQYYQAHGALFSYSTENFAAARVLAGVAGAQGAPPDVPSGARPTAGTDQTAPAAPGVAAVMPTVALEVLQKFFSNPAQYFYQNLLQVRLLDPQRDILAESEMFDRGTLEDYALHGVLVEDLLARSTPGGAQADYVPADDTYWHGLQERALTPLGSFGRGQTKQRFAALKAFLNEPRGELAYPNLYQALQALRAQPPQQSEVITVPSGGFMVAGRLPLIGPPDGRQLLRFRYASIKAKDRVQAWVAHVVGHAAGARFATHLVGKDRKKDETIAPLSREQAGEILARLLVFYAGGCRALLPFAPASSYAYAAKATAENPEEAGESAAEAAWSGPRYPEVDDDYLRQAWGDEGPMRHAEFGRTAQGIWQELVAAGAAPADGQEDDHA